MCYDAWMQKIKAMSIHILPFIRERDQRVFVYNNMIADNVDWTMEMNNNNGKACSSVMM